MTGMMQSTSTSQCAGFGDPVRKLIPYLHTPPSLLHSPPPQPIHETSDSTTSSSSTRARAWTQDFTTFASGKSDYTSHHNLDGPPHHEEFSQEWSNEAFTTRFLASIGPPPTQSMPSMSSAIQAESVPESSLGDQVWDGMSGSRPEWNFDLVFSGVLNEHQSEDGEEDDTGDDEIVREKAKRMVELARRRLGLLLGQVGQKT
ncbi:hypothetical protein DFS34DRAFT_594914 [Phlyctochytrium arcticum]|nr:hypothetical protein DFS34DRAFT_594914 [Phlyctochytrium arcticum]